MHARAVPPTYLLAAAGVLLLLLLIQSIRLSWQRRAARWRLARRREQGAAGEVRAEALLRRLGYRIVGRQVCVSYGLELDGASIAVELRADYVVAFAERRYVAEVKTGRFAPRIDTPATRRQLLEYRLAFDVDGVLLVDADAARVHTVEFPLPTARRPSAPLTWLLVGLAVGAGAAIAARASF